LSRRRKPTTTCIYIHVTIIAFDDIMRWNKTFDREENTFLVGPTVLELKLYPKCII